MKKQIQVISLGAGVQSSAMALMAACGEITPMPEAAFFADTQAEPVEVYKWLDWLETQLPFPVIRCTQGNLTKDSTSLRTSKTSGNKYLKPSLPVFIERLNGKVGLLPRQCTSNYKIDPLRRAYNQFSKNSNFIQWMGISTDETVRIKDSRVKYIQNRYPLIEMNFSRSDCLRWMKESGFPEPPRSACIYCPYHSDAEWIRLRDFYPEEFAKAVEYERSLQIVAESSILKGTPFLHRSCIPLKRVVFQVKIKESNQFNNECEGHCGV